LVPSQEDVESKKPERGNKDRVAKTAKGAHLAGGMTGAVSWRNACVLPPARGWSGPDTRQRTKRNRTATTNWHAWP